MARRVICVVFFSCASLCMLTAARADRAGSDVPLDSIPVYDYAVINTFTHDPDAFTQGLYYKDGYLYEGTGIYGQSTLRKVIPETGEVVKLHDLPAAYFGEGVTIRDDIIHQLTWRNYTMFRYVELDTFAFVDSFPYTYVGWGLTHDDTSLISSSGGARLYHLDPETYEELSFVSVTVDGSLFGGMNEMELIQGKIWANIYGLDSIAVIVPETGVVESWVDLSGLRDSISWGGVLNGIAFDPEGYRLFVTGKKWPAMFEVWVDLVNYPPVIVESSPPLPYMCIDVDSTVALSVSAEDANTGDVLDYIWSINGVTDPAAHDSFYIYSSPVSTVDTVKVKVSDGMFSDSTSWFIAVAAAGVGRDLDGRDVAGLRPPRIVPNPFSGETRVFFSIPRDSGPSKMAEVSIYDVLGRRIKTLVSSRVEPGDHETLWDGRDSRGRRVSPGIYVCTLKVGGKAACKKLAMLD